jgi:hypothetical protein
MDKKAIVFLSVYFPFLFLISFLTLDKVNTFSFPTIQMTAINLLPLVGTFLFFIGIIFGSAVIWFMGEKHLTAVFLGAGLIFNIIYSAVVCNVFRQPVLLSISEKKGRTVALKAAQENREYERAVFSLKDNFSHLVFFINRQDEQILRKGFMEGYKNTYKKEYPQLIDREKVFNDGYLSGYNYGYASGRNAGIRNEKFEVEPLDEKFIKRIKTDSLEIYVKGYKEGYPAGWKDGYLKKKNK